MFDRLDQLEARYEELTKALSSPEIAADQARYQKSAKAHSDLTPVVERYREFKDLKRGIAESRAVIAEEGDAAMRAYAEEELGKLEARLAQVSRRSKSCSSGIPTTEERGAGDPHRRRRLLLRLRDLPHVRPLRRASAGGGTLPSQSSVSG
jgi:protein subunit release factor A